MASRSWSRDRTRRLRATAARQQHDDAAAERRLIAAARRQPQPAIDAASVRVIPLAEVRRRLLARNAPK